MQDSPANPRTAGSIVFGIAVLGMVLGVFDAWIGARAARTVLALVDGVLLADVAWRMGRRRWSTWLVADAVALAATLGWLGFPALHALRVLRLQGLLRIRAEHGLIPTRRAGGRTPEEVAWTRVSLLAALGYAAGIGLLGWRFAGNTEATAALVTLPTLAMVVTVGLAWVHARALAAQQTRALLDLALPKQVAAHLARHPGDYHETVTRPATIVFVDIEGFTATVERLQGDHAALKRHLEAAMDAVAATHAAHDLLIDKFIGDAVMSFRGGNRVTGTPEEHAARCVRAALDSLTALAELGDPFFHSARIGGASTDAALIGTFGASDRISYTVLGDGVNLASRLESANRYLGTRTLFCERTHALTRHEPDIAWRRVGKLMVKGKSEPQDVFEALRPADASADWMEPFATALALFEDRQFAAAWELFAEVDAVRPGGDGPARVYLTECNRIVGSVMADDWTPVIRAA